MDDRQVWNSVGAIFKEALYPFKVGPFSILLTEDFKTYFFDFNKRIDFKFETHKWLNFTVDIPEDVLAEQDSVVYYDRTFIHESVCRELQKVLDRSFIEPEDHIRLGEN